MGDTGLEHPSYSSDKTGLHDSRSAGFGAVGARESHSDTGMAAEVEAWPTLPVAFKVSILAMIRALVDGRTVSRERTVGVGSAMFLIAVLVWRCREKLRLGSLCVDSSLVMWYVFTLGLLVLVGVGPDHNRYGCSSNDQSGSLRVRGHSWAAASTSPARVYLCFGIVPEWAG